MATTLRGARDTRIADRLLPLALALAWICDLALRQFETSALGTELSTAVLAIPLALWAFSRYRPDRRDTLLLVLAAVPVLLMLAAALTSTDTRHSLLGSPPLWQGWFLWAGLLTWFCLVSIGARRHDLLGIARVLSVAGTICAVWALAQLAGMFGGFDAADAGALAIFDNPQSLGQALAVTIACTIALILLERPHANRRALIGYGVAALIQLTAVVVSGDRAALLGLFVGAASFAVTTTSPRDPTRRALRWIGAGGLATFLVAFAIMCATWSGALGPSAFLRMNALLTNRLGIWNQASERAGAHLALGQGPSDFESVVIWNTTSDGRLDVWRTPSEHSILLTWTVGAGLLGVAAYALGAIAVGLRIARVVRSSSTPDSVRCLSAGIAAAFVAMLFSWPEPLALVSATCIAGCFVAAGSTRVSLNTPPRRALVPAIVVAAATMLALVSLAPELSSQYRLGASDTTTAYMANLRTAVAATHDPSYLDDELSAADAAGDEALPDDQAYRLLTDLAADYPRSARHSIGIPALALELLWQRRDSVPHGEFWRLSRFYVRRGIEADPDLGIWRYALARAAVESRKRDSRRYISAALAEPQPDGAEALLHAWELRARSTEASGTR